MKIGPKVYGKQESVKSQDFPPGGKIGSKMAPVNKNFLKVPEIKKNVFKNIFVNMVFEDKTSAS